MKYIYNDGGRKAAGFKGDAGDCATRAIAIATGRPYKEVYDAINEIGVAEILPARKRGKSNARTGVHKETVHSYMAKIGWKWTPTMRIGSGCKVHVRTEELPVGKIILNLSKHYAAVIDGVLHDTFDCSRDGSRCVYGYWRKLGEG